jgi:hypothetical protein
VIEDDEAEAIRQFEEEMGELIPSENPKAWLENRLWAFLDEAKGMRWNESDAELVERYSTLILSQVEVWR